MSEDETIVALSSGALPAGIAVLRVSGPAARAALAALGGSVPEPRRAALRSFRDGDGAIIDRGLALFFPGPGSATGEDLGELHLHGGPAVAAAALRALTALPGVRLAEAGEFTRRAFANGRIDLTEAEGLADLLVAETEGQRRQAVAQAGGALRTLYESWMGRLVRLRALLEAEFDFSDEGDVADDVAADVAVRVADLASEIRAHLNSARRGEILRDGFNVVIAGPPNAGKSSLLNALAERDVAIVSAVPGTTRDVIEVRLDLGGVPVRLADTAGLRETGDAVEAIGIERARQAMAAADLVLLLADGSPEAAGLMERTPVDQAPASEEPSVPWPSPGRAALSFVTQTPPSGMGDLTGQSGPPVLRIRTKIDAAASIMKTDISPAYDLAVSSRTGQGLDTLIARLASHAAEAAGDPSAVVPARLRQREILADALAILDDPALDRLPPELVAETLRRATDRLGALTGRVGVEDLLDVIFSEFCIGK
ncbi:tRNA uridine-5-carboxymethylaminomethyl(34) synthesis GTPase MnmE [Aureimonas sp. AU12]|uniref:tRNA uridine-5-carboxymethylaminomethyl(34) synthesis GTPase MnmE n=1 Tax=Aureimonas sp. AU12 TaxID=1638161 RepID=UPI001FCD3551|nr:tRNA uridine-5-carboxymethylaminomethyl(34) synthesis GTPase MnmE [Aureimonas sp. AU12]